MKKGLLLAVVFATALSCSSSGQKNESGETNKTEQVPASTDQPKTDGTADDQGIGKFRDLQIDPKLNTAQAAKGKDVYEMKCSSCHKLNGDRVVGPGWQGVTQRHRPEWIMNFVTNVDEMLNKDPKAQAQLEICLVRMPNQNLSDVDARNVYEFMRQNDGAK